MAGLLAGCPAALPPNLREATMRPGDMPGDVVDLIKFADEEDKKQSPGSEENAVLAIDKGLEKDPNSYELLWRGARSCAWLTDEFTDHDRRASWAEKGVSYAKRAVMQNDRRVEGLYYYGINLGQDATTKTVGAYLMVGKVKKAAESAKKIDEKFDHAGPGRLLGNIYAKAPPWPASIGDTDEGVTQLKRVVEIAPDYPQNHLHYADALYADGQYPAAEKEYQVMLDWQLPPELAYRGARWKQEAEKGMKKAKDKEAGH
jgi:tetratricopeptide (TPR) repeat protein